MKGSQQPKISIIIPVYNVAPYLEECLESVLSQTLREIEVICINDGSTDHSLDILQRYASENDNVFLLSQSNQGTAKARNQGLILAQGEFVAFMDPDDSYPDQDILECLYAGAREQGVLISGGSFSYYKNGTVIEEFQGVLGDHVFNCNCLMTYKDYQFPYGFTRFIYNLEFIKRNNISFPAYVSHEDPPFMVKAMIYAGEFYAMKKITYQYRIAHKPVSLTVQKTVDCIKVAVELLTISQEYKLGKLHAFAARIIYHDIYLGIYKFIGEGHHELGDLLLSLEKLIDNRLITDVSICKMDYPISPFKIKKLIETMDKAEIEFRRLLIDKQEVVIYGAGLMGQKLASVIHSMTGNNITCYAVTNVTNNCDSIGGIPVKTIEELNTSKGKALILVATPDKYHNEIAVILKEQHYEDVHFVNMQNIQFFNLIEG